jgi:hypothetical protein
MRFIIRFACIHSLSLLISEVNQVFPSESVLVDGNLKRVKQSESLPDSTSQMLPSDGLSLPLLVQARCFHLANKITTPRQGTPFP